MLEDICSCQDQFKRAQKLLRQYKNVSTKDPGKTVRLRAEIHKLLNTIDDCYCDEQLRDQIFNMRIYMQSLPEFGGGKLTPRHEVHPGPKVGYRLVDRSGDSIFMRGHSSKQIHVGTIQEDPQGLYFFTASLSDPKLREGIELEAWSIGDNVDSPTWLARPLEFWKVHAYNWVEAPNDDDHEGVAQRIVYVKNMTDWYNKVIREIFSETLRSPVMQTIDFRSMDESIPPVVADFLTGGHGDFPGIIPETSRLIPEAIKALGPKVYTGDQKDLIQWIRPRASAEVNEFMDEYYGFEEREDITIYDSPEMNISERIRKRNSRRKWSDDMRRLLGDRYVEAMETTDLLPRYSPYSLFHRKGKETALIE